MLILKIKWLSKFTKKIHLIPKNRQESGKCRACWNAATVNDVQVNGKAATMNVAACCGYLDAGTGKYGYDCIEIPNATKTGQIPSPSKVCGHNAGLATDDATIGKTVCSKLRYPNSGH